jgi:outer membrane protein insertion porin family
MRKSFLFIVFIIFYFSSLKAEVVKSIQILGNQRVSEETVKLYGGIKINEDYTEKKLNEILNDLYSTNFFEDVKVSLSNGILKVNLSEFPVINELVLLGEPSKKYKEEILKLIRSKKKGSYIKNDLSKDIDTIKSLYASIGFNFAEVTTKIREIDKRNLDLIIEVKRGAVTKISKISFIGDKKIKEKRLRDVIASEENKFWKFISKNTKFNVNLVQLDTSLLTNYYKSIGYYDVKIISNSAEIKKSGNIELIYSIDAGNRYVIKKITTEVDSVFDKNIFYPLNKEYKKVIGDYYSPFKIKRLLEDIDDLIEKNNLQFVEHNVEEIIEDDSITIKFNIYEGQKVLVERINVLGNNITNENVIRGELTLDEGDPFTSLALEKSIAKIKSRNIFKEVTPEVVNGSSADLKIININIEEKPTGEISAGLGIGTTGGSVGLNVQENNWLGEGKRVGFDVEISEESLRGTVSYTNPNYNFYGNSIGYTFSSISNDKPEQGYENKLITTSANTRFEQYKDFFANVGVSASYDDLKTTTGASSSLKSQEGSFSELAGDYGFTLDKRNRTFMPTDGSIISFDQSLPIYADKSFISNTLSASFYNTYSENVIGATKFFLTSVNGLGDDDVRLTKRRYLSPKRLRGFESGKVGPVDGSDHIGGNYAAAINIEAQLPNFLPESTKTDVGIFLDFGNVWGVDYDGTIQDTNEIRSSTGAQASWVSPLGPMTFILSTNLAKSSTDKTETFNFNLGTTF